MPDLHIVILAAGKGTRMRSALPKVVHRVGGLPMIEHVLRTAASLGPASTVIVVGHEAVTVRRAVGEAVGRTFVVQEPQLGTAHALLTTEPVLKGARGTLLLLSGDVPLLRSETLNALATHHHSRRAAATVVTAIFDNPHGYGRIVRTHGAIDRIAEERDADDQVRAIHEINAGIYAFALDGLFDALRGIAAENAQREYYLPDLIAIYRMRGLGVETITVADPDEIRGINSRAELAVVNRLLHQAKNEALMAAGVTLDDPATTYVDPDVVIGSDTVLHAGVTLEGHTTIGARCQLFSGVRIANSTIGDDVIVHDHCVITDSSIARKASVGPFAHLRNATSLGEGVKVGNFVEMKKSVVGRGTKSMHLTYLGDAIVGANVNVGAGTITCNYDGTTKQTTTIEDGAFIGSDSQLIAPVTVGEGAYVGTGTTVRENVPAGSLAVSAGKQRNIEGWVEKRKAKTSAKTSSTV